MKTLHLLLLCALCVCACARQPESTNIYDPAREPLTADELASLLGVYHWKITQLPESKTHFWGVRVVARNSDNKIITASSAMQFEPGLTSHDNCQILVGLDCKMGGAQGRLIVTNPGKGTSSTHFQFAHLFDESHGEKTFNGGSWEGDKVTLVIIDHQESGKNITISLEALHQPPARE